jgi:PAS domain S-box-containing protein
MAETFMSPDPKDDLRQRAEEQAGSRAREAAGALSGEETESLLHELEVHRIELELQNEELRRAQADLEASRARYFDLYDLAPVGYCTLDELGVILEANLTAARMFGLAKDALVGKPLTDFIHRESQDTFYRYRRQLLEALSPQTFELLFKRSSDASFWGWVKTDVAHDSRGARLCRVAFTDITLLKQTGGERTKRGG